MKGVKIVDNIEKLVRERRSFRTFDGREVTAEDREKLTFIHMRSPPIRMSKRVTSVSAE